MNRTVERAVKAAGSKTALGALFGISRQAVNQWGDRIPANRCRAISETYGIPLHELRPDIYPAPERTPAE